MLNHQLCSGTGNQHPLINIEHDVSKRFAMQNVRDWLAGNTPLDDLLKPFGVVLAKNLIRAKEETCSVDTENSAK